MSDYIYMFILPTAFVIDCLVGDPNYPLHPVRLIGQMIDQLKRGLFEVDLGGKFSGFMLTTVIVLLVINIYLAIRLLAENIHPYVAVGIDIFCVYSSIALKDMVNHVKPIMKHLNNGDIDNARLCLQKIVGRKTNSLDTPAIARASIESVAESFVDGFFAPVFWYTVVLILCQFMGGFTPPMAVAAILTYRAINTMDSMVGYKNEEFIKFGWFPARLDDVLNFIPARLSLVFMTPAALFCGLNVKQAWRIALRDRLKHQSPNSAHAESFAAGALDIKLGGPTTYSDGTVDKPWLGDGIHEATPDHIRSICRLVQFSGWISIIVCVIVML